jgi:hypothetical protein
MRAGCESLYVPDRAACRRQSGCRDRSSPALLLPRLQREQQVAETESSSGDGVTVREIQYSSPSKAMGLLTVVIGSRALSTEC